MKYLKVLWHHDLQDEPVILYSEIDDRGLEHRKVYVFRSGPPGFADSTESTRSVFLSTETLPPLPEIAADPQFTPEEISNREFEIVWLKARSGDA